MVRLSLLLRCLFALLGSPVLAVLATLGLVQNASAATPPAACAFPASFVVQARVGDRLSQVPTILTTSDHTLLLAVKAPKSNAYTRWRLAQGAVLAGSHSFTAAAGINQERIDVGQSPTVSVIYQGASDTSPSCQANLRIFTLQHLDQDDQVAVVANNSYLQAIETGSVNVGHGATLMNTLIDFDGRDLRLTGHLQLFAGTSTTPTPALTKMATSVTNGTGKTAATIGATAPATASTPIPQLPLVSTNLVAFTAQTPKPNPGSAIADTKTTFNLAKGSSAEFNIPPPASEPAWTEPTFAITSFSSGGTCEDIQAELRLGHTVSLGYAKGGSSTVPFVQTMCAADKMVSLTTTSLGQKPNPQLIQWTTGATKQGSSSQLKICAVLETLTLTLPAPTGTPASATLVAKGTAYFPLKQQSLAQVQAACVDPKFKELHDTASFSGVGLSNVGFLDAFGYNIPTAEFVADKPQSSDVLICKLAGSFVNDGANLKADIRLRVLLPATIKSSDTPRMTSNEQNALATSPPCPDAPELKFADAKAGIPGEVDLEVKNVNATVRSEDFGNFTSPDKWTDWKFQQASLNTLGHSTIFGHEVEPCASPSAANGGGVPDPQSAADAVKLPLADNTLCIGVHVSTKPSSDDSDVAYGILQLCKTGELSSLAPGEKPVSSPLFNNCPPAANGDFQVTGFTAQLPKGKPATIRLGVGSVSIQDIKVELVKDGSQFDEDVGADRLAHLGCSQIDVVGSGAFAAFGVSNSLPLSVLSQFDSSGGGASVPASTGTPATSQTKATIAATLPAATNAATFSMTPLVGLGGGCAIFALQGFLPIQLTQQSLITITSLTFASSKDVDGKDLFFLNVSGSVTSGNITAVFRQIGFRTLAKREQVLKVDANGKQSTAPDACISKNYHETKYGGLCVVSDINWPLTTGISLAQNSQAIGQIATGVLGALVGVAVKH